MAMAREEWGKLSEAMQHALTRGSAYKRTCAALAKRGISEPVCSWGLLMVRPSIAFTPWGLMVREAGLAARAEGQRAHDEWEFESACDERSAEGQR